MSKTVRNPILSGFYPDPSICRNGDDYYLVTTSQEFFPGLPVFHSRDLARWEQIGHVLDRPEQIFLDTAGDSQGVCAPTIRFINGLYYVTSTLVRHDGEQMFIGSFACTAASAAGPWSEPHWIEGAPGLDPSLFRDDDGRVYYQANDWVRPGKTPLHRAIWAQELDPATFRLKGERKTLLDAADWVPLYGPDGCASFDGPHIYKNGGWYYLLIAAGDTHWNHSMLIFRSRRVFGPYEPCPHNPIMTHRHFPKEVAEIACVGHGDFLQTPGGRWWVVFLATRPYAGQYNYLGRETMLAPVDWSGDWPQVSPRTGRIETSYPLPEETACGQPAAANPAPQTGNGRRDDFDGHELDFQWNFIRTPREPWWTLGDRPGHLRLKLRPPMLHEQANPSFIGRRVQDLAFSASTMMAFAPRAAHEEAGLVLYKSGQAFFRLVLRKGGGGLRVCLIKRLIQDDRDCEIAWAEAARGPLLLRIDTDNRRYRFSWSVDDRKWRVLDHTFDVSCLSQTVCGGYGGIYVGLFAGGNGQRCDNRADFDWFEYRPLGGPDHPERGQQR